MDRRDLSVILIFLMLAVGGGLPQALHWAVDHDCCGTDCAINQVQEKVISPAACCPHHQQHDSNDHRDDNAPSSVSVDDAAQEVLDEHVVLGGEPIGDRHDCPICQFLATLSAIVAPALITPVHLDSVEWTIAAPGTMIATVDRNSSQGPRAPPHDI